MAQKLNKKFKNYTLLTTLGQGSYSTVYKAVKENDKSANKYYAVKVVHLDEYNEKEKKNILNEIRILASLDHPNIIKYYEAFIVKDQKLLW